VTARRDAEFTEYVSARLPSLRRLALLLCHDWHRADDLVQAAITLAYLHWKQASAAEHTDAYVRAILVREFLHERRSAWARLVSLGGRLPEPAAAGADQDAVLDLRGAVGGLPPRQRAVLVLRYYCDLSVAECAQVLGCSAGTVKSQTAKALGTLRRSMRSGPAGDHAGDPAAASGRRVPGRMPDHV
jgi:RNA polymerase sigma-70 factor (sigma-E family)